MKRVVMLGSAAVIAGALAAAAILGAPAVAADGPRGRESAAEVRLDQAIEGAMRAEGPFFTPGEHALIERKCGYAPGSWDGKNFSINNGVLECTNGRRVDDPEVRAMMKVATPRIQKRVKAMMARPEVRAAIGSVARQATAEALRDLGRDWD